MFRASSTLRIAARCALTVIAVRLAAGRAARAVRRELTTSYHEKHERLMKIRARYRAAQENLESVTLADYFDLLDGHDWSYPFSDDLRVFANGEHQARLLDTVAEQRGPAFGALQDAFRAHHYGGDGWGTPAAAKPPRPAPAAAADAPPDGARITRAAS